MPQDPWSFVATRIRFNTDGSIDAMVIDNEYEFHWKRVPVDTPSGYFDLAIEYNGWGSDTSGFPTYYLFINNQQVFSGTGLGSGIGQVAIVSPMETSGPTLDIDNFNLIGGEYIPVFVKPSPKDGTIPAGESVEVEWEFDASSMKFGSYQSDMIVHLDEPDSLIVPAALTVTGEASMLRMPYYDVYMESNKGEAANYEITLMNIGGLPIQYDFDSDLPGLTIEPEAGILAVRENLIITLKFEGDPGMYSGKITLTTDIEHNPIEEIPVDVVVFDTGAIFNGPSEVQYDIQAGEITTRNIQVRNDGKNTVSFRTEVSYYQPWVSLDPAEATVSDAPLEVTLTFDAREVSAGTQKSWVTFKTNDINRRTHRMFLTLNILPDTVRSGKIIREEWTGIRGNAISSIPVETPPSSTSVLTLFESPANKGDNYGSRIRGYIRIPFNGYYTFWITSNDNSELWLSMDDNPANKVKIATVTGYTNARQWDKYATQRSDTIYLVGNRKYYIEALHKEGIGTDHLAVGWQLPNQTFERPIPGLRLIPYGMEETNESPHVSIITPTTGEIFPTPAIIEITADASDDDGSVVKVEFYNGAKKLGVDISAPYAFTWKNVAAGNYTLIAKAIDNLGATDTAAVNVVVTAGQSCAEAGKILREEWTGIPGTMISSIPVNSTPSSTGILTIFEGPSNVGDKYGSRISGYLCVPASGNYTFWISSNDKSELWLSTDVSPNNKVKIAYVSGYTNIRQWTKYPTQQSPPISLIAGQKYYIEALQKEGVGTDHIAVGWELPDGSLERPIPGIRLLPYQSSDPVNISVNDMCMASGTITREYWTGITGNNVSAIPINTTPANTDELTIFEGPSNIGTNYGTRIRGYICPPATGNYSFWISSNDHSELWLSTDENPNNKIKIAFVTGATSIRQWEKYSSQKSAAISLTEGKTYYIEALHKQGVGSDNIAVGWQLPDGTLERPIPGNRLSPVKMSTASAANKRTGTMSFAEENNLEQTGIDIKVFPNPVHQGRVTIIIEGFAGTERTTDYAHIDIRHMTGLSVYSDKLNCKDDCNTVINVNENFTSGVYIIQVRINNKTFTEKLVVH